MVNDGACADSTEFATEKLAAALANDEARLTPLALADDDAADAIPVGDDALMPKVKFGTE